jgi:hypothetical protein
MDAEANLPIGTIDWKELPDAIDDWIVIETSEMFVAKRVEDAQGVYLVEIPDAEAHNANKWLRVEAARDREDYDRCRCCGHAIHRKLPTFPFCGPSCRDFEP